MRSINDIEQDIKDFTEELIPLVSEDVKLFRQGCNGRNSERINYIGVRLKNLRINLNQIKQTLINYGKDSNSL